MRSKAEVEAELAELSDKLYALQRELEQLEDREQDLKIEIEEIERTQLTQDFLAKASELDADNSMHVRLHPDTKTTPIMDAFYYSDKEFLVFDRMFVYCDLKHPRRLSLIITNRVYDISCHYSGLTMTNLKKITGKFISEWLIENLDEGSRQYPLYKEIVSIIDKIQESEPNSIITFQTPCILGGQTFSNQSGYGSEYCGEDLVYQGTLYGETTEFLIIGVLVE